MLRAVIRKTLFGQNVSRGNSSNFNDVKLSRSTVHTSMDRKLLKSPCHKAGFVPPGINDDSYCNKHSCDISLGVQSGNLFYVIYMTLKNY